MPALQRRRPRRLRGQARGHHALRLCLQRQRNVHRTGEPRLEECPCTYRLTLPQIDGGLPDSYVWVDRWQQAVRDFDGHVLGCQQPDCECHDLVHFTEETAERLFTDFIIEEAAGAVPQA